MRTPRLGDVRLNPNRRNQVEILVEARGGGYTWAPYLQFLKDQLVACCPNCRETDKLRFFLPK